MVFFDVHIRNVDYTYVVYSVYRKIKLFWEIFIKRHKVLP